MKQKQLNKLKDRRIKQAGIDIGYYNRISVDTIILSTPGFVNPL